MNSNPHLQVTLSDKRSLSFTLTILPDLLPQTPVTLRSKFSYSTSPSSPAHYSLPEFRFNELSIRDVVVEVSACQEQDKVKLSIGLNFNQVRPLSFFRYQNCRNHVIRALASARGSAARRAQGHRIWPLEGPKGPRVAETSESEGPKGPRTSKAKCPFWRLPVLLYVFHNSAQNRESID